MQRMHFLYQVYIFVCHTTKYGQYWLHSSFTIKTAFATGYLIEVNWREIWMARKTRGIILTKLSNIWMMFRFFYLVTRYTTYLASIMRNLAGVGLLTKSWANLNLFHSSNLQTIGRPKLMETLRNGKTSTFLIAWMLEM